MKKSSLALFCLCLFVIGGFLISWTSCKKSPQSVVPVNAIVGDPGDEKKTTAECITEWEASGEATQGTGGILRIAQVSDADVLNPLSAKTTTDNMVTSLMFSGLTRTLPNLSHGPNLAKRWEHSDDNLELTFYLRDDITWHDGEKFTAHDVTFSHRLMVDPEFRFRSVKYKQFIKECVALDDYTVKFVFTKVYPYQVLDASTGWPVPKHLLEKIPPAEIGRCDFSREPIGNGPFRFKEWKTKSHITLIANKDYFGGRPPLDTIILKIIPEETNRILQLKSGAIDMLDRVPWQYHSELYRCDHLVPHILRDRVYYFVGWNLRDPLFTSKAVRRALTMAINRPGIAKKLFGEHGEVCETPISPLLWAHNPQVRGPSFDPKQAVDILNKEGWKDSSGNAILDKNGQEFSFELKYLRGEKIREYMARYVQAMLKDVGIEVRLQPLDKPTLLHEITGKKFQAVVAGWSVGLKVDMTAVWHSKSVEDPYNYISYANPELDRVNDLAILEPDREKAKALWWKAQEIIVEDQPYTFLCIPSQANFVHKRFKNIRMKAIGWYFNVEHWWVPKALQKN